MPPVFIYYHHPGHYSSRSSLFPLIGRLGATPVLFDSTWERWQRRSWTLGHLARRVGQWYFGSTWNAALPLRDDAVFQRTLPAGTPSIAHFLFAEFIGARRGSPLRRRGATVLGTFHASRTRQPTVLGGVRDFGAYDWLSVVSHVQIPYFVEKGFPAERIRVTPLGVDSAFFCPDQRPRATAGPLRGLIMGSTERDHAFLASVLRALPAGCLELAVRTDRVNEPLYRGVPGVTLLPALAEEALVESYRAADLLLMPMTDCTANNAILEAMACGTPVMVNGVGGIPEYVDAAGSFITDGKDVGDWVGRLTRLAQDRSDLIRRRPAVRAWAERFDWDRMADVFRRFYRDACGGAR
jgi:glycosyltransferase involved in cell wall biosynthesis